MQFSCFFIAFKVAYYIFLTLFHWNQLNKQWKRQLLHKVATWNMEVVVNR